MNGYDAARCSPILFSQSNFLRSFSENKLHSPCIQYVTAKVTHSAENAKRLALSGVVAVWICCKVPENKVFLQERTVWI